MVELIPDRTRDVTENSLDKPWYRSKTMWFNIATVGGTVMAAAVGLLPTVEPAIAPSVYPWVVVVVGLANAGLRTATKGGIKW